MPQHKRKARRLHRGGRPRKEGLRTKSGRLSRASKHNPELRDQGTPQFVGKRTAMVNGGAPELSATASGILLANEFLTQEQHVAAMRYAWAHARVYGPVRRQQCLLGEIAGWINMLDRIPITAKRKLEWMNSRLTPAQERRVPLARRPPGRDQLLRRGEQRRAQCRDDLLRQLKD